MACLIPNKPYIRAIVLMMVLLTGIPTGMLIAQRGPKQEQPSRNLELDVSKQTTHFTEPIRQNGTIDYVAAINKRQRNGVIKQNNAFAGLLPVIETAKDDAIVQRRIKALGLTEDEIANSPKLLDWYTCYQLYRNDTTDRDVVSELLDNSLDALSSVNRQEVDAAWTRKIRGGGFIDKNSDLELLAAWVRDNDVVLDRAASVLKREHYWTPLIDWPDGDGLLVAMRQPYNDQLRELAKLFRASLFFASRREDTKTVIRDIHALSRLTKHLSNVPTLIGNLVAISVESQAIAGLEQVLGNRELGTDTLAQISKTWGPSDRRVSVIDSIDIWERCMGLDGLMQLASGQTTFSGLMSGIDVPALIDTMYIDQKFDVNRSLIITQGYYNHFVDILIEPKYAEFSKRISHFEEQCEQRWKQSRNRLIVNVNGRDMLNNSLKNPQYTEALTDLYLSFMTPALSASYRTELRVTSSYKSAYTAIAVERYRLEHGKLPDTLKDLVPEYISSVPHDPFNGDPLMYRKREAGFVVYSVGTNLKDDSGLDDHAKGDSAFVVEWKQK